jgi:CIC family chloride channel protein
MAIRWAVRGKALRRRLERSRRALEFVLAKRFALATREDRRFFLLIPAVGVVAGLLGITVHRLIRGLTALLWGTSGSLVEAAGRLPPWVVVGAPALGGVIVALIVRLGRESLAGQGMSMLIEAVALKGGKLQPRPVLLRALAAVATVGSGGSLGREGPMIRLGSMIASWLGSRLGLSPHRLKTLVGCGAAAGLAAAYNIPIGGALFAMEVILGNFALEIFGPIVVASVISTVLARAAEGDVPIYAAPDYGLVSGWELLNYAGLGLLGALVSIGFILGVRTGAKAFGTLRWLPAWLHPVLGMTMVGGLALWVPHVLGGGFDTITLALQGALPVTLLLVLPVAKLLATALTAGSGSPGGLFTPALFVGAVTGAAYGHGIHFLWPEATGHPGGYAAVGMAAVAAGTSHAPLCAILILFEFTGNYGLILPLMVSSILASLAARRLYRYSIYTEALQRRGVDLAYRMEEAVLAGLAVGDLTRPDEEALRPDEPYRAVVERFLAVHRQRLFVVGEDGRLQGAVSLHDIKHALEDPEQLGAVLAHDLMVPAGDRLRSTDRLHQAAELFARSDFERLPVCDAEDRFQGVLAKRDLLAIYAQEVLGRPAMLATFVGSDDGARNYVELPPDFTVRMVSLPPALAGRTLAEARLPQNLGLRVLELRRQGERGRTREIPGGSTVLREGDALIVLGPTAAIAAVERGELPAAAGEAQGAAD